MDKYEALDKFRDDLMDEFISFCDGNDFNTMSLLQISETVDAVYDNCIDEIE